MYNKVHDEVLEGLMSAALNEYIETENKKVPDDEQLSKMYPLSKKEKRWLKRKTKEKKHNKPLALVYLSRAAVIFLCIVSLSFAVLMTNSEVRAAVVDAVITWYEDHVRFDFSKSDKEPEPIIKDDGEEFIPSFNDLSIGYVPDRFELTSDEETGHHREYVYYAENGDYFVIAIYDSRTTGIGADTEYVEYEPIKINGNDGHILYNEEERYGVLIFGNSQYTVMLSAMCEKSELIEVAESIIASEATMYIKQFVIGYIPEEFEEASRTEESGFREYIYYSETGDYLLICMRDSKSAGLAQDSELHEYEKILLNDTIDAYLFYNDAERSGTIVWGNNVYTIDITGLIDKEELIKVAENILPADDNTKKNDDYVSELKIGYIPDGFEALDIMETVGMRQYTYYNEDGEYIYIEISVSESTEVMLDVETHEYEEIDINDNIAYLTYDESDRSGSLVFGNKAYTVLISVILDKDELIKVAENIK